MVRNALVAVLAAALLSGCASAPTAQQQMAADYGAPMDQEAAQTQAKTYLDARLRDPYSAVYTWGPIEKGYIEAAPLVGQKMEFGYLLNVTVNSKNAFGGYTGAKAYQFFFRDGQLRSARQQECLPGGGCYMAPMR